jgi:hypothetical protein
MLAMASDVTSSVWPVLHCDDMRVALRFPADARGFRVVTAAADAAKGIVHAELGWPGGGALVFGGTRHAVGCTAACAVAPPRFGSGAGSYAMTVRDPEGNLWTFGTYKGATSQAGGQAGPGRAHEELNPDVTVG